MTMFLNTLVWGLSILLLIATLLPFSKMAHGAVRGAAFLREQLFVLAIVLVIALIWLGPDAWAWVMVVALIVSAGIHLGFIIKFTPMWTAQSVGASDAMRGQADCQVSILAVNVKQSNRSYERLVRMARARQADLVLAVETDAAWIAALRAGLGDLYPHWLDVPLDNTYGMCLMSRLELSEAEVRELITKDVPSIRAAVILRNREKMRLYVIHPEPPVIHHDTIGRDSEIAMIGLEAAKDSLPAVVAGDLNDVAWSTTTRRFQRLSGLLDPRVGRGFYNTFSATMPWMRWPLDHLFHTPHFRLLEMARLDKIGSDHFPMWFVLGLAQSEAAASDPGRPLQGEKHKVIKDAVRERARPREAIGSDWEDEG